MVRWVLVTLIGCLGACSGRSTGGTAGAGGTGGSAGSGGASAGATTGGTGTGGANTGGTGGGATGGGATGGSGTGGASTGGTGAGVGGGSSGSPGTGGGSAGAPLAGTSGAGTAGEGGTPGECTEPNPAGCRHTGCPDDQTCMLTSGRCVPSSCECDGGDWLCTDDCGGGICVEGSSCNTPNPSGCGSDAECADGQRCLEPLDDACIPLGCACTPIGGEWDCIDECGGGECRVPDCPLGCEAGESTCDDGGVTWVCGIMGDFDASELVDAGCTDLATQIPRFCCPASFKPECQ